MTDLVTDLTACANALPSEAQARLAQELLATLDPGDDPVEVSWDAEIRKRLDEVANGTVRLIPTNDAFAQVRRALRR